MAADSRALNKLPQLAGNGPMVAEEMQRAEGGVKVALRMRGLPSEVYI
jgi:hypothetical protein